MTSEGAWLVYSTDSQPNVPKGFVFLVFPPLNYQKKNIYIVHEKEILILEKWIAIIKVYFQVKLAADLQMKGRS